MTNSISIRQHDKIIMLLKEILEEIRGNNNADSKTESSMEEEHKEGSESTPTKKALEQIRNF